MAQTRWDAVIQGDFEKAYAMFSPASRTTTPINEFIRKASFVKWLSVTVGKVTCADADLCTVEIEAKYAYNPRHFGRVENVQRLLETWRNVDGEWWYVASGL